MYGYYIIIKGIEKLSLYEKDTLFELLSEVMNKPQIRFENDLLIGIDQMKNDISWESFILTTNSDFYSDLRLYESVLFNSKSFLLDSLEKNKTKSLFIKTYNNDKTLFYQQFYKLTNENVQKQLFKGLFYDKEFLRSIKIYLEKNQNKTKAAKEANLHRNSLEKRLEKFYNITGYDVRNFKDAAFIYLFLKDY